MADYPDSADLKWLTEYAGPAWDEWLERAVLAWNTDYGSVRVSHPVGKRAPETFRFATGGWSGNEDIIDAMDENKIGWMMTWQRSERGGLYVFTVPEQEATDGEERRTDQ